MPNAIDNAAVVLTYYFITIMIEINVLSFQSVSVSLIDTYRVRVFVLYYINFFFFTTPQHSRHCLLVSVPVTLYRHYRLINRQTGRNYVFVPTAETK